MSLVKDWPNLSIADDKWDAIGGEDPTSLLKLVITINGLSLHLYALGVRYENGIQVADCDWVEELDALDTIAGEGVYETTTINGREYVLVAHSFLR